MQRSVSRGFAGSAAELDAQLDALLDASDIAALIAAADARTAALQDVDPLTALQSKLQAFAGDRNIMLPVALGAVALGVLLLLPEGGRRR